MPIERDPDERPGKGWSSPWELHGGIQAEDTKTEFRQRREGKQKGAEAHVCMAELDNEWRQLKGKKKKDYHRRKPGDRANERGRSGAHCGVPGKADFALQPGTVENVGGWT